MIHTPSAQANTQHADTDILIVGGGMIGAALCLSLRTLPWRVCIADARLPNDTMPPAPDTATPRSNDFDQRVSALALGTERWLAELGAWEPIPTERLGRYDQMQVWDAEGTAILDLSHHDADLSHLGHIVENRVVEAALWQCLNTWPELQRHLGSPAVDAQRNEHGHWVVRFKDGSQLSTRLLVMADGAQSPLRGMLGFTTREWDYLHHAIVATVSHEQPHNRTARQAFHRTGPLAFLPLPPSNTSSIVWSLVPDEAERFLSAAPEQQGRLLTQGLGHRLGDVAMASSVKRFPLRQRHAADYIMPGAVLVGDAAHSIHPLAGQGANIGLLDAQALAAQLRRAAEQRIPLEEPLLLRAYQRARKTDNLLTMAGMEFFQHLFTVDQPAVHWLRNNGMRWFGRCAPLRRTAVKTAAR
ncbi:FAD-dependent monooxygenase [Salinispirillum marinum]|uniref:FAD-dependent monooxygenase n=2 Tax=Saccharospirillaceae TaxID=255527 RepID=A0ABV8BDG3_9GAMM